MKQHINQKDLNQLSQKGKARLEKWWQTQFEHNENWLNDDPKKFPNIGQLIEFLDRKFINFWRGERKDWLIVINDNKHIVKDELCDTLWEEVKVILNKE